MLGVGLTLALLSSLLVGVVPASAAVSSATVTLDDDEISATPVEYNLIFSITAALEAATGDIVITFPTGFDISGAVVRVAATSGIGTPAFPLTAATDTPAAQVLTIDVPNISGDGADDIGVGATVQVEITNIQNGPAPGDYVLKVKTTGVGDTTNVDSQEFTLVPPDIPDAPGIVTVCNDADIPMDITTGFSAIADAIALADTDWLLIIGAGTYNEDPDTVGIVGLRFQAQVPGTARVQGTWDIDADGAVLDGLNIEGTVGIAAAGTNATIQNCSFKYHADGTADLLSVNGTGLDLSGCDFDVSATSATNGINATVALDVDGCDFTVGSSNYGIESNAGLDVLDSTFTGAGNGLNLTGGSDTLVGDSSFDGLNSAIRMDGDTLDVQDSTFTGCGDATATSLNGVVDVIGVGDPLGVVIYNNTFRENNHALMMVGADAGECFFKFNDCDNAVGIDNNDAATLDATNNWFGSYDGPTVTNDPPVDMDPWLPAPLTGGTVVTGVAAGVGVDASLTVGVEIQNPDGTVDCVALGNYASNPVPGSPFLADVVRWFEINLVGIEDLSIATGDEIIVCLQGITNLDAQGWAWSTYMGTWVDIPGVVDLFTGEVRLTLGPTTSPSTSNLNELVFALTEPAVAPLAAPTTPAPALGADDVDIDPTFTWAAVAGATSYEFQIAEHTDVPGADPYIVPFDSKTVETTGCRLIEDLSYDTTYDWRVRAVRGTEKGPWMNSFLTTMMEPEEPEPPIEVITQGPTVLELPDWPETIVQPQTPIIPDYLLWVVVGVGGVLVIAVIVLIVRTRRVA